VPRIAVIVVAGGLYVDLDVTPQANADLAAYGADIAIEDHG